jgi:hypothetical protein
MSNASTGNLLVIDNVVLTASSALEPLCLRPAGIGVLVLIAVRRFRLQRIS